MTSLLIYKFAKSFPVVFNFFSFCINIINLKMMPRILGGGSFISPMGSGENRGNTVYK